jgi:superfamily II DNA or RNA helicase
MSSKVWEFLEIDEVDPVKRGYKFEKYVKKYLEQDLLFSKIYKEIIPWYEWDERPYKEEIGIDLVGIDFAGEITAIQAKAYNPKYTISKSSIDSFITASNLPIFKKRLLIGTTNKIGKNALTIIRNEKRSLFQTHLLSDLEDSNFLNIIKLKKPLKKNNYVPREHQKEVIKSTINHFKKEDLGQIIMACGTGKTLTSFWISEKMKAKRILFLAPSISLLSQTLKAWVEVNENKERAFMVVCSDITAGKYDNEYLSDFSFPSTTNPKDIKRFINQNAQSVIFSTYQSSKTVMNEAIKNKIKFDLVICDEAHRLTGNVDNNYGSVLKKSFPAKHKLFMTATPRIVNQKIIDSGAINDYELFSMDDNSVFGNTIYELSFGQAIEKKLLSDYQIVITGVTNKEIESRPLIKIDNEIIDIQTYGKAIALKKYIQKNKLKKTISFHTYVKNAKIFSGLMRKMNLSSDYISGKDSIRERSTKIKKLNNVGNSSHILSNAKVLSEGIDIPELDSIVFIDPKKSIIDIVQSIGRAIRASSNPNKIGHIIIPVLLNNDQNEYQTIYKTLLAMRAHDSRMGEQIDNLRIKLGENSKYRVKSIENLKIDIPSKVLNDLEFDIQTRIVNAASQTWYFWFGLLKKYTREFGTTNVHQNTYYDGFLLGKWVTHQRGAVKKGKLDIEKSKLLEEIDFIVDANKFNWEKKYNKLLIFYKKHGHLNVKNNKPLLNWIEHQREYFQSDKLLKEREKKLNEINFNFLKPQQKYSGSEIIKTSPRIKLDDKELQKILFRFIKEKNRLPKKGEKYDNIILQAKFKRIRVLSKEGKIDKNLKLLLIKHNFKFFSREEYWQQNLIDLKNFAEKNLHTYPTKNDVGKLYNSNLHSFVQQIRYTANSKDGRNWIKLSDKRIKEIKEIPFWTFENPPVGRKKLTDQEQKQVDAAKYERWYQIVNEYWIKESQSPTTSSILNGLNVGLTVSNIRKAYKDGNLPNEYIKKFKTLKFTFDPKEDAWNNYIEDLLIYSKKFKNTYPPKNTIGEKNTTNIFRFSVQVRYQINNPDKKENHKFNLTNEKLQQLRNIPHWNDKGRSPGKQKKSISN